MPWTEPRARMTEYVAVLGALFEAFRTGHGVRYEGDAYRVTRLQPYFNPGPKDIDPPHIWLGAVNAGMCELAGRDHLRRGDPFHQLGPGLSARRGVTGTTTWGPRPRT